VIQRNIWMYVMTVMLLVYNLTKSLITANGWKLFLLIDILNTDEVLYALSLFTFSLQPIMLLKLQS
jgi:hypothetical protein